MILYNYFLSCNNKLVGHFDWLTFGHVVKVAEVALSGERGGDGKGIKARLALSRGVSFEGQSES